MSKFCFQLFSIAELEGKVIDIVADKGYVEKSIKVQTPNPPKVVVYAAGFTKPASNICLYIAGG